ncbi:MAG: hypothetical protein KA275_00910 [Chitinophagaceae bacterium]|nr:hypothetical protein [Chitinophagaceae bacterium]
MKKIIIAITLILGAQLTISAQENRTGYGQHLVSFQPIAIVNDNIGVGLTYENFFHKNVSLKIPVMYGLNNTNYAAGGIGLKFYPSGHNKTVTYAIGPEIYLGYGKKEFTTFIWDQATQRNIQVIENQTQSHFGFRLNNSLNITISKAIYLGMDLGLGINYIDKTKTTTTNNTYTSTSFAGQFGISIGYRF